ncbi:glycoside hydrolase [Immersiella caudata]|uniref:alpha-1,2-Mannosidase n=1 Tax=Immersiella caudata TaxID=314043 RepID=A0AA39TNZ4_9PEZI|nr:glycoside hydrolase [Immersiella caudata]
MMFSHRRKTLVCLLIGFLVMLSLINLSDLDAGGFIPGRAGTRPYRGAGPDVDTDDDPNFFWRNIPIRYPVQSMSPLPTGRARPLPKIQAVFGKESAEEKESRRQRRDAVKKTFVRCWESYKAHAWMSDEVAPISGRARNPFGGWGATLVDSLDTLWIMGLRQDFDLAVAAAANISFETVTSDEINVFETNIRYLGGFLAAYDLSGDKRLLRKAKEVGDMLYAAFDTPNRMPITRWRAREVAQAKGVEQVAGDNVLLAEIGSFAMEFTRISILTGDPKWFDAAQRITEILERQQDSTALPGIWPLVVNAKSQAFNGHNAFTLGAMADSTYEYLPKTYALSGGRLASYRKMYEKAAATATNHNFFRPMIPDEQDILISAMVKVRADEGGAARSQLDPEGQHLVCFAGGMFAIGAKLLELPGHLEAAQKLVDGCIWTYQALPLGIMPETFHMIPCPSRTGSCPWNETLWKKEVLLKHGIDTEDVGQANTIIAKNRLPKGFTKIGDTRYILRPEAIESVFVLYRTTGQKYLLDAAWAMWKAIEKNTRTELASAALADITVTDGELPPKLDSMESFWMGETLKYFYLVFSEPDEISLDEFVFNTEAHPFRIQAP